MIQLDADTQLTGVPPAAWDYRLGSRTALGWVLDQHKERAPKDRVVRERFNTYRSPTTRSASWTCSPG